ncbi:hypothetical protein [Saccharopolyspora spinosa]|uniref:hypothetical protein n=1 Tax=Saccharopolyspora spinosa TaxID=60894 RepID=UPI0002378C99|nr:hypothetical protein [Saccharopolyspora spinosa]
MNLDELFRRDREAGPPPADHDLTVRRWMNLVEAEHRRRSTVPGAGGKTRSEMELFEEAERALAEGRRAESCGDLIEAAKQLTAAASGRFRRRDSSAGRCAGIRRRRFGRTSD